MRSKAEAMKQKVKPVGFSRKKEEGLTIADIRLLVTALRKAMTSQPEKNSCSGKRNVD